jgi:hypothetical protein
MTRPLSRVAVHLALILATLVGVTGCATTRRGVVEDPPADPSAAADGGEDRPSGALSASDRAFIEESLAAVADRSSGADQPAPTPAPTPALEPGAVTVESVAGFVSFSTWTAGRESLREAEILEDAGVDRLRRIVFVAEGRRAVLFLDVDSRRLPVAWSLLRSPWKREGRGLWRDPATGATLELRRNESWIYSSEGIPGADGGAASEARAADAAGAPSADAAGAPSADAAGTVGKIGTAAASILDETAWETADLLHRHAVADVPGRSIGALVWLSAVAVEGLPAGLLPATATLAFLDDSSPEAGGTGPSASSSGDVDDTALRAAVALPFGDDRAARTASVAVRLLVPALLEGTGVEIAARSGIVREDEVLILTDVTIRRELVVAILGGLVP